MKIQDIESDIMECWNVVNDIEAVLSTADEDQLPAAMNAVRELYDIKFNKLFNTYESFIRANRKKT